jgi:TetR/AcrR family transcriptional regulator, transcriptional repressor for nem operon
MLNTEPLPAPTRERLIAVARQLFGENGYLSTSIADILRTAGVHSGSLYYFFHTKQDLLLAVLRAYRDGIDEMLIEPAWRGVEDPVERVFALLGAYRRLLVESECTYGCPIGSLALELHEPDPQVRHLLAENFDAWKARIAGCFEEARDRLPEDVSPQALGTFVLTVMEGAVMQSRTYRSLEAFDASVGILRELVRRLLATGQEHHPRKGAQK